MTRMIQRIKDSLVTRGPTSILVRAALCAHGLRHGYVVTFPNGVISVRKGDREIILSLAEFVMVPLMLECYNMYFDTIEAHTIGGRTVLDFSQPRLHRYRTSGVAFHFPSIPEDEYMDAYTDAHLPKPGDVVWDVGAHAGATAYFLAQLVGPTGKVYAFEPDELNYAYLLQNIALHKLHNVVPIKKALSGATGTADFLMDGTMSSGLNDYRMYADHANVRSVDTITFVDACAEFGEVPSYVKMDIEGAEIAAVEGALALLPQHPVHFAIESYHWVGGELTWKPLEQLFSRIGYDVRSSAHFGLMFTWANPPGHADGPQRATTAAPAS